MGTPPATPPSRPSFPSVAERCHVAATRTQLPQRGISQCPQGRRRDPGCPEPAARPFEHDRAWPRVAGWPDDVAFARETAAHLHGLPIPLGVDPTRPIHTIRPLRVHGITPGEVSTHLSELDGRRGVRRLRELAPLLRPGSASPKESETRLLLHDHGLPEPELNGEIFDDWGTWIATSDFVWRDPKVVGEYDGDQHRTDRTAWQYERARRARLEDCGWTYVELTQAHLSDLSLQGELLRRLRRLLC